MQFLISFLLALFAVIGAQAQSSPATSTQTFYTTISILRVAQATTASSANSTGFATTTSSIAQATISGTPSGFANGTSTWTSGSLSSTVAPSTQPSPTNAASRLGMDVVGMAAIAGLIGMVAM